MRPYPGRMARSKPTDATAPSGKAGRGPAGGRRGRSSGDAAKVKLDKKGQPKVGRLKKFGNQLRMIKQAYSLTRKNDPKLPWLLIITFVAVAGVVELIAILLGAPFLFIPLAVLMGLLAALKPRPTTRWRASPARLLGYSRACAATGG